MEEEEGDGRKRGVADDAVKEGLGWKLRVGLYDPEDEVEEKDAPALGAGRLAFVGRGEVTRGFDVVGAKFDANPAPELDDDGDGPPRGAKSDENDGLGGAKPAPPLNGFG